jgi:hypothetical protein
MENTANKYIDEIHDAIDALLKVECWNFVDELLLNLAQRAWRTELDELVTYATSTLPAKSKLPSRERFMITCKHLHPKNDIWKGLM